MRGQRLTLWVTAREAFWIALEALRTHKMRSFLTLFGVVIATTTLIVVMSIVNGMNLYIAEHIANLGTNTFILFQFKFAQSFDELPGGAAEEPAYSHRGLRISSGESVAATWKWAPWRSSILVGGPIQGRVIEEMK